ncbi:MAG: (d)CMP kinase, partial [Oscillospiraceae bacterium]
LLDLQRDLAKNNNIVMDGRDIGTVILPNAQVKFFLTASPEVRATRRYNQLKEVNKKADYNEILANIIERDKNDITRELAPLKKADDAIELDNTAYDFNTNLEHMYKLFLEKDVVE